MVPCQISKDTRTEKGIDDCFLFCSFNSEEEYLQVLQEQQDNYQEQTK